MKKIVFICLISFSVFSQSAEEILDRVDHNQAPDSIIYEADMVIQRGKKTSVKKMKMYGKGKNTAFTEFLAPPRDKGTRYLRLEENLWMFLPGASKTIKISGHMLRQSMMGSDFSYEDQTQRLKLKECYTLNILNDETFGENPVWVIELTAREGIELTYYRRKIWVDKEKYVVWKSEMYAKSGKLLKILEVIKTLTIKDREYASHIRMTDVVRNESYTDVIMTGIELDVSIPERIFSLENLERRN